MEKGPCNVNHVNGSCNLMISCHLCVEMEERSYVNGARLVSTEERWQRDQGGDIGIADFENDQEQNRTLGQDRELAGNQVFSPSCPQVSAAETIARTANPPTHCRHRQRREGLGRRRRVPGSRAPRLST